MPFTQGASRISFSLSDTSLNEPEELNYWTVHLFSTWNQAGKNCREKLQKIRYKPDGFFIIAFLMVKKYMHENLKHTVTKHLAKKILKVFTLSDNYYQQWQTCFRFYIKQYWHFYGVTAKQYCTLFQTSNNTDTFRELLVHNTKEVISSNIDIFREFFPN